MTETEFKTRTKQLALRILKLVDSLPTSGGVRIIGNQLGRAGTTIGANYRAACRAKSAADIIYKLSVVEEEADEVLYWLELLAEGGYVPAGRVSDLQGETQEILAMTVASIKTLRRRAAIQNPKSKIENAYE